VRYLIAEKKSESDHFLKDFLSCWSIRFSDESDVFNKTAAAAKMKVILQFYSSHKAARLRALLTTGN